MPGSFSERLQPVVAGAGFELADSWLWDGSVIRGVDDRYHLFATRWSKDYSMHPGWIFKGEIVRAIADNPLGPYTFEEVVLPARGAEYWDGRATFNGCIRRSGDTYLLYYTGTTHPIVDIHPENSHSEDDNYRVAQSNKRVGLASAPSLMGPWTRADEPILDVRPGRFDSFLTSNPAPFVHDDGSVLLVYKARRYIGNDWSSQVLAVARANHWSGPYSRSSPAPILAGHGELEDPHVWFESRRYRLLAKDMSGAISGEEGGGIAASSIDGDTWEFDNPVLGWSRTLRSEGDSDGLHLGAMERPFILVEDGHATHLVMAVGDGPGDFGHATRTWITVIALDRDSAQIREPIA